MIKYLTRLLFLSILGISAACSFQSGSEEFHFPDHSDKSLVAADLKTELYSTPPPPISDLFPCSQCHAELEVNSKRRELTEMHDDIIFDHDSENRWCLACHDPENRDSLRLASGINISFNDSYKLCGQCHGPKLRDWRMGIHGKRTGDWNGKKEYLLCVHCHDPHSPKFKALEPMPRPKRPEELKLDSLKSDENEQE